MPLFLFEARLSNPWGANPLPPPTYTHTSDEYVLTRRPPSSSLSLSSVVKCMPTGRALPPLLFLSPRWNSSYGYCGEASLQMILLARGVWIGQAQARSLARCGSSDLILDSRAVTSCKVLLPVLDGCGVVWCGVLRCDVLCCAVVRCDVMWCDVVSCRGVCLWCYKGSN